MAAPVWNIREIFPPMPCLVQRNTNFILDRDVKQMQGTLKAISCSRRREHLLRADVLTLSKLLYKIHNQQRNMKCFRMTKMILKACLRLDAIDLPKISQDVLNAYKGGSSDKILLNRLVPDKNFMEYLLQRLMGSASLCLHICSKSLTVFSLLMQNFRQGNHFMTNYLLFVSIIARIQVLVFSFMELVIVWYEELHSLTSKQTWLNNDEEIRCELPKDIRGWLGEEYNNLRELADKSNSGKVMNSGDSLTDFFHSQHQTDSQSTLETTNENQTHKSAKEMMNVDLSASLEDLHKVPTEQDLGVPVSEVSHDANNRSDMQKGKRKDHGLSVTAEHPPKKKKKNKNRKKKKKKKNINFNFYKNK